jgi:hypothetical protein
MLLKINWEEIPLVVYSLYLMAMEVDKLLTTAKKESLKR